MKYEVLYDVNVLDLEKAVTAKLELGFQLAGGVCVCIEPNSQTLCFFQAVSSR